MSTITKIKEVLIAEGPETARVVLVGQNPGKEEIKQKRPFVGKAGKYLDRVLEKNGILRSKLYITSVVKVATPKNRRPTEAEIEQWMPVLIDEINKINPEIVVLMGRVAWKTPRNPGIEYITTYHPAAAMRFPKIRKIFERDMENLGRELNRVSASNPVETR